MTMKVRIVALDAMGDVTWFMEMMFLTTLIAYQRSQTNKFAAMIFADCLQLI